MVPADDHEPQQSLPSNSLSTTMSMRRITRAKSNNSEAGPTSISAARVGRAGGGGGSASKLAEVTEEMVLEERDRLLRQKQTQLDQIFNKHDDLIRETFHMVNWKSMLGYNPVVAKTDESQVFRDYKSAYDLLRDAEPAAGHSRRTRRAANELKSMIEFNVPGPSTVSAPLKAIKRKPTTEKWEPLLVSAVVGKGKGKEKESPIEVEERGVTGRRSPKKSGKKGGFATTEKEENSVEPLRSHTAPPRNRPGRTLSLRLGSPPEEERLDNSILTAPRTNGVKRRRDTIVEPGPPPDLPTVTRNGKQKRRDAAKSDSTQTPVLEAQGPKPISSPRTLRLRLPNHERIMPKPGIADNGNTPCPNSPQSPTTGVKRIKLVVRKPMPSYSSPWQRPDRATHNHTLSDLLSSYAPPDRSRYLNREVATREREAEFRREGRFIPGTDLLFGTKLDGEELPPLYEPPKRETRDHWDNVIDSVAEHYKLRTEGEKVLWNGREIAAGVAEEIKAYWEVHAVKREKMRVQEEKRLRALAKATIKSVVSEWKRAVHHIREQERLQEEEEERRRGQEHLEALLDQSGQLLSSQKARLRQRDPSSGASSMSERLATGGEDSDDESSVGSEGSGGQTDIEDAAEPSDIGVDGEESDHGFGMDLLIMDEPPEPTPPPDSDPLDTAPPQDEPPRTPPLPSSALKRDSYDYADSSSLAELDLLLIPDPETSPVHPMKGSPLKRRLVDYTSSSGWSPSPSPVIRQTQLPTPTFSPPLDERAADAPEPANSQPLPGDTDPAGFQDANVVVSDVTMEVDAPPTTSSPRESPVPLPQEDKSEVVEEELGESSSIPAYLRPYAVAPVKWDPTSDVRPPLLLRGTLRPYQQSGLEWLANLHTNNLNGILADEMGLGKTIQTIALLAHLACDRGIWGPHLIIVPTSVILNWEMEFKKFLPGFKVLAYHGGTTRRKELRKGWMDKFSLNVCITSYALASRDQKVFKRKNWYYMILDEAHMIKNFKSQRWNILLMFRSFRRLLLTGTPLQNNLTELWALLQFIMSGSDFADLKEFGDWFSNPLERAIEMGQTYDEETMQLVSKLHAVLRPYLLRRLKRDVEKELPSKYDHLLLCPLSKRQRFLYDEFMSRAQTKQDLESGVYQKIANILMQLRKVCNHPDLFEIRPIVTSFAMPRSAVADFEIKELFVRKRWLEKQDEAVNLDVINLNVWKRVGASHYAWQGVKSLDATVMLPYFDAVLEDPPPRDTRTIAGFRHWREYQKRSDAIDRWSHVAYLNRLRCNKDTEPTISSELISMFSGVCCPIVPLSKVNRRVVQHLDVCIPVHATVKSYEDRAAELAELIDCFAFVTPPVVALDIPRMSFPERSSSEVLSSLPLDFDQVLHSSSVKLQIAFPDPSLLQYDCGKLQRLAELLREKKEGGHRVLIFTQMTRILDILEIFLNFHGYLYLRLDGATKIEDRQYITERFNADSRVFCFISSSRSGGVGINLTGADTVVFYDSDFNPQMDRQCEDRAHRIGQVRDVHIYRFVSQYTVEEAMLRKANQKRSLDDIVIQKGEFDWDSLLNDEGALTRALGKLDEAEDAHAAALAQEEAFGLEGADEADFGADGGVGDQDLEVGPKGAGGADGENEEEEGGTTVDYMVAFVEQDWDFFRDWRV